MDNTQLWILVHAPFREDGPHIRSFLEGEALRVFLLTDPSKFTALLSDQPSLVILTQEALTPDVLEVLRTFLAEQPAWCDVPVILIGERAPAAKTFLQKFREQFSDRNITVLDRPLEREPLLTRVKACLAARERQLSLRDQLTFQERLQAELNHRVKNILANVSALFFMTARQCKTLEEFSTTFQGRLDALSRIHSSLVSTDWSKSDVKTIAELILDPYRGKSVGRVSISGPYQSVGPVASVTLSLCLHELATNAAKYGALSTSDGRINLGWKRTDNNDAEGPVIEMVWQERGGPSVVEPKASGFGTRFIRSAIQGGLRGSLKPNWREEGLDCLIRIPVAALEVR